MTIDKTLNACLCRVSELSAPLEDRGTEPPPTRIFAGRARFCRRGPTPRAGLPPPPIFCFLAVCLVFAGGCGTGSSAPPSGEVARTALEKALTTWRDGGKPGSLKEVKPAVQVSDTPWSQGERLGSYEILHEDTGAAEKRFTVRLSLAKPERVEQVQYYVLGKDPVMVFRDQDYLRNINMEEGPKLNTRGTSKAMRKR